jgi:hypothetical protein
MLEKCLMCQIINSVLQLHVAPRAACETFPCQQSVHPWIPLSIQTHTPLYKSSITAITSRASGTGFAVQHAARSTYRQSTIATGSWCSADDSPVCCSGFPQRRPLSGPGGLPSDEHSVGSPHPCPQCPQQWPAPYPPITHPGCLARVAGLLAGWGLFGSSLSPQPLAVGAIQGGLPAIHSVVTRHNAGPGTIHNEQAGQCTIIRLWNRKLYYWFSSLQESQMIMVGE